MLSSGQKYKNFTVLSQKSIPEIQCTLLEITHNPTGAYIVHLINDDDENLFNLSFRTYPDRSDGVAHILEHTVLCGSANFPIRDPFFSMNKRSLNTFMNALTGSDFTCYPASSQVPADFYNLLSVYLDAVFQPSLTKLSFLQEGHRIEFLTPDDPNTPLLYKGVVFNEMKGAMAPPDARLAQALMSALFPDVTYGINSGGDPKDIPNLTYEDLVAFHQKYYHPSRCLFYFYGNIPTERHLDYLEEHAFKDVQPLPPLPAVPDQKRFSARKTLKMHYPISEEEKSDQKMLLGMAWLTCSILDQQDLLALNILDVALTGTDASPLKMALLKSGLCKQADSSLDNDLNEIPFLVVCKGCKENAADALEELVRAHLQKFVQEGVPNYLIEGAIHQIEFSHKEITGNSSPYGLSLFWRSCLLKQHGGELEDGLKIHTLFQKLHTLREDPGYFPRLIQKYFLDNPHFVRVEMHPDKQLASKELEEEKQRLINLCQTLKPENIQDLILQSKELEQYQAGSDAEDLEVLPKVTLADVNPIGKEFALLQEPLGHLQLQSHACFTNDITYADLVFDLPYVEPEKLPFLRLFSVFLTSVGCGGRNYAEQLDYLLEHTGGVGTSLDLCLQASDSTQMRPYLNIRGKALNRKLDKLFPLFTDLVTSADFKDVNRLGELLMQHLHGIESSIHNHSLRYAVSLAARGCSTASTIMSSWSGLDYYWALKKIVADFEKSPDALVHIFEQFQTEILGLEGGQLVIGTDYSTLEQLKKAQFYGLSDLPAKRFQPWNTEAFPPKKTHSQARITSSPVAFTASLFSTVPYTHPLSAALSIASEIMENKTLHARIREQGGAYGSGAVNSTLSGQFYFYAYRDPHLKTSLDAFRESIQEISAGNFTPANIEEAQLGLFQNTDSPIPPGSRANTAYTRLRGGLTPETRQQFRTRLLNCTTQEIQEAAAQILTPGFEKAVTVIFAGKDMLEKENALLDKKLNLYPVETANE